MEVSYPRTLDTTKFDTLSAGAIPAPTSTVTIYAVPFGTGNPTPLVGGTHGVDVSVLGVSSGFAGTETTYSIGEYVSYPASTSVVVTITSGSDTETTTVPVQNSIVYTENCEGSFCTSLHMLIIAAI